MREDSLKFYPKVRSITSSESKEINVRMSISAEAYFGSKKYIHLSKKTAFHYSTMDCPIFVSYITWVFRQSYFTVLCLNSSQNLAKTEIVVDISLLA